MQFSEVMARTWDRNILFSVLFELTYRCNLDCYFCYNDLAARGRRLELSDYIDVLDDLEGMGTMNVSLSGGEPLLCPFFFEMGRAARERGFVIRVKTNAHAMNLRLATKVKDELDPFNLDVSVHGAKAETHDRQTQIQGSFERLMRNVRAMKDAGLRFRLHTVLTAWNEDEIEAMYEIADGLGLDLYVDSRVTARDDGSLEPLTIAPSREGLKRLIELERRRHLQQRGESDSDDPAAEAARERVTNTAKSHCGAGAASVTIDPFGNVYPCVQWRRAIGNLHEQSIRDIWTDSPRLEEVRAITRRVKATVDSHGENGANAAFCPAIAEQLEGSPETIDRGTLYRIQVLDELDRNTI